MIFLSGFPRDTNPAEVSQLLSTFGHISFFEFVFDIKTAYVEYVSEYPGVAINALNGLRWKFKHPLVAGCSFATQFCRVSVTY